MNGNSDEGRAWNGTSDVDRESVLSMTMESEASNVAVKVNLINEYSYNMILGFCFRPAPCLLHAPPCAVVDPRDKHEICH